MQTQQPLSHRSFDPSRGETGDPQGTLSESVIPAVPGEYYGYHHQFTDGKPLYALMKCKSQKARVVAQAEQLGCEANLFFEFESAFSARVHAIKKAHACGLLGISINGVQFGNTWVASTNVTAEDFYALREQKDVEVLVEICTLACNNREESVDLVPGIVVAMMTDTGKYGMFLVRDLTPKSILVDACHILLK
jgi:hypothetical protein